MLGPLICTALLLVLQIVNIVFNSCLLRKLAEGMVHSMMSVANDGNMAKLMGTMMGGQQQQQTF
jgi:hypothetical protein